MKNGRRLFPSPAFARHWLGIGITALLALLSAACGGPFEPADAGGDLGDSVPEPTQPPPCQEEDLVAPILVAPADQAINPTYGEEVITQVLYPDASCIPDGFEREVYTNPGFGGNANNIINPSPVNIPANTEGYYGGGQLTQTLQDCTQYFWHARAFVGNAEPGPFSETRTFFTDFDGECDVLLASVCDAAELLAPNLIQPLDNEVNPSYGQEVITVVVYPDANCFPDSFERFVSPDPGFSGANLIINPSPVNLPPDPNGHYGGGQLTLTLQDCTQYYWRARAKVGGAAGPYSETWTFFTDFNGTCPTVFDKFDIPKEIKIPDWPWVWPMQNTNCRTGDTSQHKNVGTLFPDQVYDLLAVNPEETYVKVHITSLSLDCWVWMDLVVIGQGIHPPNPVHLLSQLPVEDPAPPPTAVPTKTPTKTPVPECSDGIDNDSDRYIDLADPQCRDANDVDEANP